MGDDTLLSRAKEAILENFAASSSSSSGFALPQSLLESIATTIDPQDVRRLFHRRFPQVQPWIDQVIAAGRNDGAVRTLSGFTRKFFAAAVAGGNPSNNTNNNRTTTFNANYYTVARQAVATVVQGTAADILKMAICNVFDRNHTNTSNFTLVSALHDELLFVVEPVGAANEQEEKKLFKQTLAVLKEKMCEAGELLLRKKLNLPEVVVGSNNNNRDTVVAFRVPLQVKVQVGDNLGDMKEFKF
jgi:hypothetical protein